MQLELHHTHHIYYTHYNTNTFFRHIVHFSSHCSDRDIAIASASASYIDSANPSDSASAGAVCTGTYSECC